LGLPGKLIASSLAKYVQSKEVVVGEWDQLQSLVQAFAINIGIQIGLQIHLTKVKKALYRVGYFNHPNFLHTIQVHLLISSLLFPITDPFGFVQTSRYFKLLDQFPNFLF
jgi:hypothetical protein